MPTVYRVLRLQDFVEPPGLGELFSFRTDYAGRMEDALNYMSAEGWELVAVYEHQFIFRHDGETAPAAVRPAGRAWSTATVSPGDALAETETLEPFDPDRDLRDDTAAAEVEPAEEAPASSRIRVVHGDLIDLALEGRFDVIVHGCNCRHTMGGGIARQIKNAFPEAEDADLATEYALREKLGTISTALVQRVGREFTVVNAYTQFDPGANADYDAIRSCFREIQRQFAGRRIGYPRIGAGIGGGDWAVISRIIDEELAGEDHTLVEFQPTA